MNNTINLTRLDGTNIAATLICFFENINDKKQYLYYTLNEINGTDANSTVKIYCAKVRQNEPTLDTPISESTWEQLKGHMAEALKSTINPDIKFLPISSLVDKTVISEKVIAMPVSYDYINKHYELYINNVTDDESATLEPVQTPLDVVEPTIPLQPEVPSPVQETVIKEQAVSSEPIVQAPISEPIEIATIEEKYAKMIDDINKLKEQEIEAVKRYNATIELSSMHNEQHASYVQSEQTKGEAPIPPSPAAFEPTPVEPMSISPMPSSPEPIEPIVQAPTQTTQTTPQDIETNWFDMPIQ